MVFMVLICLTSVGAPWHLPLRKNIHFGVFDYTPNPFLVQMVTFAAKGFGYSFLWELQKK